MIKRLGCTVLSCVANLVSANILYRRTMRFSGKQSALVSLPIYDGQGAVCRIRFRRGTAAEQRTSLESTARHLSIPTKLERGHEHLCPYMTEIFKILNYHPGTLMGLLCASVSLLLGLSFTLPTLVDYSLP